MQNYGATEMASSWRTVRMNTVRIAEDIPADQYGFHVTPDTMSAGQIFAHLATYTYWAEQVHFVEKKHAIEGPDFGKYLGTAAGMAAALTTKGSIVDALLAHGESFAMQLETMTDEQLDERVALPNAVKTRFEMLLGIKEHEMHHRAQLMVMERLLGIVPHLTRARMQR